MFRFVVLLPALFLTAMLTTGINEFPESMIKMNDSSAVIWEINRRHANAYNEFYMDREGNLKAMMTMTYTDDAVISQDGYIFQGHDEIFGALRKDYNAITEFKSLEIKLDNITSEEIVDVTPRPIPSPLFTTKLEKRIGGIMTARVKTTFNCTELKKPYSYVAIQSILYNLTWQGTHKGPLQFPITVNITWTKRIFNYLRWDFIDMEDTR